MIKLISFTEYFELKIFWCENILKKIREIDFFSPGLFKIVWPAMFLRSSQPQIQLMKNFYTTAHHLILFEKKFSHTKVILMGEKLIFWFFFIAYIKMWIENTLNQLLIIKITYFSVAKKQIFFTHIVRENKEIFLHIV